MARHSCELGEIHIGDDCIAEVAGRTTLECYGVVGMGSPGLSRGVVKLITPDKLKKGVHIERGDDTLNITLYVVVEYGTNLPVVAHNLMAQVKYNVEHFLGLSVGSVDVNVQSVNISR